MTPAEIALALVNADVEVRRAAIVDAAKQRSAELAPQLISALADRDFRVRQEAVNALSQQAIELGLLPQLIDALAQRDDVSLRGAAREVLRSLGAAAVDTLVAALSRVDDGSRKFVVEALATSSASAALPVLMAAVASADVSLSLAAMDALAHLGGTDAVLALRKCLREGSSLTRTAALDALVRLQIRLPWDELSPLLSERAMRRVALDALGYSGDARAVRPVAAAVEEGSIHVATRAVLALCRLAQRGSPARSAALTVLRQASAPWLARVSEVARRDDADGARAAATLLAQLRGEAVDDTGAFERANSSTSGPETLERLRKLVNAASGILLPDDSLSTVQRKLDVRVQALGLENLEAYCEYLTRHPQRREELDRALEQLTTHETYFFRDLPQLQAFEREVLPALHRASSGRRTLTVWSAGCSTGEEAYTLAILILRSGLFKGWQVRVLGTDLSEKALESARRGVYRDPSFRALPEEYAQSFAVAPGGRAVAPAVKALCQFEQRNLLDPSRSNPLVQVDAIFCRNVLIYFDQASRRRVVQQFYDVLRPGGFLMLGHSESLLHMSTAFELAHLRGDLGYRKPLSAGTSARGNGS